MFSNQMTLKKCMGRTKYFISALEEGSVGVRFTKFQSGLFIPCFPCFADSTKALSLTLAPGAGNTV